jgi:Leucine-rich repeat (LRR) protein
VNNHTGPLPVELGNTDELRRLYLEHDYSLDGPLSTEIVKLENQLLLRFGRCAILGILTLEIGQMTNLKEIQLLDNRMAGTLPSPWLWSLPSLGIFGIGKHMFGRIQSKIGLATNLRELYIHSNGIAFSINYRMFKMWNSEVLYTCY